MKPATQRYNPPCKRRPHHANDLNQDQPVEQHKTDGEVHLLGFCKYCRCMVMVPTGKKLLMV